MAIAVAQFFFVKNFAFVSHAASKTSPHSVTKKITDCVEIPSANVNHGKYFFSFFQNVFHKKYMKNGTLAVAMTGLESHVPARIASYEQTYKNPASKEMARESLISNARKYTGIIA